MAGPIGVSGASGAKPLPFAGLAGWAEDDHEAALAAFIVTADKARGAALRALGAEAEAHRGSARAFFERHFAPALVPGDGPTLFTGYFEPVLNGARRPGGAFRHPVYRMPAEAAAGEALLTRAEIETGGALAGRELEIAWVDDPVALFFLHVQGSGRIRLGDGSTIRVGFAGRNGHPYRSIGQELVRRGVCPAGEMTADRLRAWLAAHPREARELMQMNASYVFFREIEGLDESAGPIGTLGRPLTAGRSVAVDPDHVPLGAPVWVELDTAPGAGRLMVAQDTGAAIRGAGRADLFIGSGAEAGRVAGAINCGGRMAVLLPRRADREAP